jgi:pyruvate/2-oxoglutarate dehydrogenase complex dihydrolipoamide acyltransferase (E2) component
MTERVARLDERIALYEAELAPEPEVEVAEPAPQEPAVVVVVVDPMDPRGGQQSEAPAGVVLTPAARHRADELGLTDDDFSGEQPSGKAGEFLVSDVQRIAEAKAHTEEDDNDGDD